jgi:uncharacterized protein YxeA
MKRRYVYVVLCNVSPIIYAIYSSKNKALDYAHYLIKYRENQAKNNGHDFGFYHYLDESPGKENEFDKKEKTIFTACLKIKDNLTSYSQDGCTIKVVRYPTN